MLIKFYVQFHEPETKQLSDSTKTILQFQKNLAYYTLLDETITFAQMKIKSSHFLSFEDER